MGEHFTGRQDVGSVHVILGSSSGLTATGSQTWSIPTVGAPAGTTDYFGRYMLAADFGKNPAGSKHGDLLIGTFSSQNDNPPSPDYLLYGDASGVGDPVAVDESSGAAADFDQDGYADLAVRPAPTKTALPAIRRPTSTTAAPRDWTRPVRRCSPSETTTCPAGIGSPAVP